MAEDLEDVKFISLHKSIRNTSWSGKILTEPCGTRAEKLGHLKGQERFLLSQVGQKNEGGKEAGWNPQNPGGIWREERSPHPGKPLTGGSPVGTEGETHSLWEENTATSVQDRVRPVHRLLTPALPTQPKSVSSAAHKGWVLECGVWRPDPGRRLWLAVRRHPEATGGREELCKQDACGGSLNHQRSRAALLSDAQREEPHCSLPAPVPVPACPDTRNGSHLGGWPQDPHSCFLLPSPLPTRVDPWALGAPSEHMPVGGPNVQMALKPQLSPQALPLTGCYWITMPGFLAPGEEFNLGPERRLDG